MNNNVARRCWDEDAEMAPGEIPYTDAATSERFLQPEPCELALQDELDDLPALMRRQAD